MPPCVVQTECAVIQLRYFYDESLKELRVTYRQPGFRDLARGFPHSKDLGFVFLRYISHELINNFVTSSYGTAK
jgi:hypothetical protein